MVELEQSSLLHKLDPDGLDPDDLDSPTLSTADDIELWLVAKLAERLNVDPDEIDTRIPLESYALESADALILLDQLETELGQTLSPTVLWNYPTIELLSDHLSK